MNALAIKSIFVLVSIFIFFNNCAFAGDSIFIKVHFLYGSKPKREYRQSEPKWFGGKHGGHVGIEVDSNIICDFNREGSLHWFIRSNNTHSKYCIHTTDQFWKRFCEDFNTIKRATVIIPITVQQKNKLESIVAAYTAATPYDYAFIGMRCGSSTYEILGQLGILEQYSYRKTYLKIFYPKILRKRLLRMASQNHWVILRNEGTQKRKWECD